MRYAQVNNGTFVRHIFNEIENIEWDADNKCSVRKLTDSQKTAFGVFKLKLVTPPEFSPLSQVREEGDAVLIGGVWTQNWTVTSLSIDARQTLLLEKAKKQKNAAFYSNVTIPFPSDDKEIHFRNELDRTNIKDKWSMAKSLMDSGAPETQISFRPKDGGKVFMRADQLFSIFTTIAIEKDFLFNAYADVIFDIRAASDTDELDAAETALNAL